MKKFLLPLVLFFLSFIIVYAQPIPVNFSGDTLWVHPTDNSLNIEWGSYGTDIINGNGADSDTNGVANTAAIVSQLGAGDYAAYLCDTLSAYGYDWYLPSLVELDTIYSYKAAIGGFSNDYYWSSTESNTSYSWMISFNDGSHFQYRKDSLYSLRCVSRGLSFTPLNISLDTLIHATTNGTCNGEIYLTVNGGSGTYSYQWSNSETTEDISNLCPDEYYLTVTDDVTADSLIDTFNIINQKPYALLAGDTIWVSPVDNSTGIAWYKGSYINTYAISDSNGIANTDSIIKYQGQGNYAAYICDTLSEFGYTDWYLPAKAELNTLYINKDSIGGFSSSRYWSSTEGNNASAWGQNFSLGGQYNGNKSVYYRVRCVRRSEQFESLFLLTDTLIHTTTNGTCDGEINITVAGGSGFYTYNWDDAATTKDRNSLCPGEYSITVTDTITTNTVSDTFTVINQKPFAIYNGDTLWVQPLDNSPGIAYGANHIDITKGNGAESDSNGYANTKAIVAHIDTGAAYLCDTLSSMGYDDWYLPSTDEISAVYIYRSDIGNFKWATYWTSKEYNDINAYACIMYNNVKGGNSKTAELPVRCIRKENPFGGLKINLDSVTHTTTNGTCDGKINLTISGGSGFYTYNWDDAATTEDRDSICPGEYSVTVTDTISANTVSDTYAVINQKPYALLSGDTLWVHPTDNSTGIAWGAYGLDISSGNAAESDANGFDNTQAIVAEIDTGAAYLCDTLTAFGDTTWYLPAFAELNALYQNKTLIGGFNPSYYWSSTETGSTNTWAQNFDNSSQDGGNKRNEYRVRCITRDIIYKDLTVYVDSIRHISCYGNSGGEIHLSVTGGIPPYTYLWSTGDTTRDILNVNAGSYTGTVTDARDQTAVFTKAVLQPQEIKINAGITNIGCAGTSSGSIMLNVTGGTPGYNYLWNNDSTTAGVTGLAEGNYTVTVDDNNGCLQTVTYTITTTETVTARAGNDKEICPGTEVSLTASGGDHFLWSTGDETAKINVAPLVTTSYIVEVEKNGCSDKDTVTVIADSANCFSIDVDVQYTICGQSDGAATLTITGGTAPFSILWSTGDTTMSITDYPAGNYNVQVKDALNNVLYKTVSINNTQGPTVSGSATDVACFNGNDGAINLTVSGGATPYKYSWSTGEKTQDIQNIRAGYYEVEVEDDNGCLIFKEFEVNEPDPVNIAFTCIDASCSGDTGSLSVDVSGGTAPYTYAWSNDSTGQKNTGLSIGTYTVTVTDDNNCSTTATTGISGIDGPVVTVDSIVNTTCNDSTGEIYTLVSGGTPPYAFEWENGSADQHLYYASKGLHILTVTDSNGCQGMASAQVDESVVAPPQICIVTTDSLTNHNLIAWEKEDNPGIAAYNIYKEVRANQYQLIGSVGETENSVLEDSLSNPMIRSYKYKISALDVCGNETMKSHAHKTIHLSLSSGFYENSVNLSWDNYDGFYYDAYQIARYSTSNNWEILDVLPGSPEDVFNSYTDTDVPDDVKKYMIIIDKGNECVVTNKKANAGPFSQSLSNLEDNRLKGEEIRQAGMDLPDLSVYPNPANNDFYISFKLVEPATVSLDIYAVDGRKIANVIKNKVIRGKHKYLYNCNALPAGMYYIKLIGDNITAVKKVLIE